MVAVAMVYSMTARKKLLILSIGNPYRGDDGAAPILQSLLEEKLQPDIDLSRKLRVVFEDVYQLQPEHIYDMQDADWVLILDAEFNLNTPYRMIKVQAASEPAIGTHSVSPEDLLGYYNQLLNQPAPECFLFTIQASEFDFVERLSQPCQEAVSVAIEPLWYWLRSLIEPSETHVTPLKELNMGSSHA